MLLAFLNFNNTQFIDLSYGWVLSEREVLIH
jgi:hypothetical protein